MRETLWILVNIVNEEEYEIDLRLFLEHNIKQVLQAHLLENFIEEAASHQETAESLDSA